MATFDPHRLVALALVLVGAIVGAACAWVALTEPFGPLGMLVQMGLVFFAMSGLGLVVRLMPYVLTGRAP